MDLPINSFKCAITSGRRQIGIWSSLANNVSVEILAGAGFDWVLLDCEHSPNEPAMVLGQLQATTGGTAHPIVRPPWNDAVMIKRLLDVGTQSFLIPYVQDRQEAERAVAAVRYPPRGMRGFASSSRASRFGRIKDYHTRCEDELCVLVQVETQEGLDNLEAIAGVDGVDGVFIGPGDLSAALGHLGAPGHPDMQPIIDGTIDRIKACGKAPGILTGDVTLARRYIERGCLFTAVGSDVGILVKGADQLAQTFKQAG
jgi:4-hydroxy-2-oxoheptanedioate aldolase